MRCTCQARRSCDGAVVRVSDYRTGPATATVGRALAPARTYALKNSKALFGMIAERAAMLPGERLGLLLGSGIVRLTEKFLAHPELARQRPARREPIKLVPKLGKLW